MPTQPVPLNTFVVVALAVVLVAICGYHIYRSVLVQLDKNAKHRRLISRTMHGKP